MMQDWVSLIMFACSSNTSISVSPQTWGFPSVERTLIIISLCKLTDFIGTGFCCFRKIDNPSFNFEPLKSPLESSVFKIEKSAWRYVSSRLKIFLRTSSISTCYGWLVIVRSLSALEKFVSSNFADFGSVLYRSWLFLITCELGLWNGLVLIGFFISSYWLGWEAWKIGLIFYGFYTLAEAKCLASGLIFLFSKATACATSFTWLANICFGFELFFALKLS